MGLSLVIVALCPASSAALINAMEFLMVGADGSRPMTLLETLNWLAQQAVVPTHTIGRSFEAACRECEISEDKCMLDLLARPQQLREELENLLSPGVFTFSSALEQVLLGNLTWNRLPGEFLFVWLLGRNRWAIRQSFQANLGEIQRAGFICVSPRGKHMLFIFSAGETDEAAEKQGGQVFKELQKQGVLKDHPEIQASVVVTASQENRGQYYRAGNPTDPDLLRMHALSDFLIKQA